jgi:nicotinamidase-related amidase
MAKSSLLTPDNHALLLIDHQYLQLLALRSHTSESVVNNTTFLARAAKLFKVPTLLTTAFAERHELFQEVQAVFPDQKPIDRSGLNSWDDPRVLDWVKKTGKKKLVMAGLWTEVCLSLPVIDALAEGFEVYIVTDASGGGSTVLLGELDRHHHVEDDYYFPPFAAVVPKLQKGFDILDNDHGVIHGAIYRLGNASRELIAALSGEASGRDGDAPRVAERLAGEIEGFDRTLLRHLKDEDDLIIPLILERTRDDPNFVRNRGAENGGPPNVTEDLQGE